jgi:hypothetical protein
MFKDRVSRRRGFKRRDLVVLLLVLGIGISQIVVWVSKQRDTARRIACVNNLKQLGLGFHVYHDSMNCFPTESGPERESLYISVLPFVQSSNCSSRQPIQLFQCPTRRGNLRQAVRDYGYGGTGMAGSIGKSILDAEPAMNLGFVDDMRNNGMQNTALLAHVWIAPEDHQGGDPTDVGWRTPNNRRTCDSNTSDGDPNGSNTHIGSPHTGANSVLFSDAHVRFVPCSFAPQMPMIWAADNTKPFTLPSEP